MCRVEVSIQEQLLRINVKRSRGGLAFQAHRLLYHSTLGLRVTNDKKNFRVSGLLVESQAAELCDVLPRDSLSKRGVI